MASAMQERPFTAKSSCLETLVVLVGKAMPAGARLRFPKARSSLVVAFLICSYDTR